ncbi:MAG TPA: HupE/UreJ family protein [Cytophagales bacterium]|nr:HupE/UreJ family protein [Cytophagales bacterium]
MNQFITYFLLGVEHILDLNGVDHILFVIALCTLYSFSQWKRLLILTTAFTLGHSLTLALSVLDFVTFDPSVIETLIPITILITAITNIFTYWQNKIENLRINYFYAASFGLIHGLGFSNYLKGLLGKDFEIFNQLLAFNLGLEVGQIVIVALFLVLGFLFLNILKINQKVWVVAVSSIVAIKSLHLIIY